MENTDLCWTNRRTTFLTFPLLDKHADRLNRQANMQANKQIKQIHSTTVYEIWIFFKDCPRMEIKM